MSQVRINYEAEDSACKQLNVVVFVECHGLSLRRIYTEKLISCLIRTASGLRPKTERLGRGRGEGRLSPERIAFAQH